MIVTPDMLYVLSTFIMHYENEFIWSAILGNRANAASVSFRYIITSMSQLSSGIEVSATSVFQWNPRSWAT